MQKKKNTPTFSLNFVSKIERTIAWFGSESNWRNGIPIVEVYEHHANGIQFGKPQNLEIMKKLNLNMLFLGGKREKKN